MVVTGHYVYYGDNNMTPTIVSKRLLCRGLLAEPASVRSRPEKLACYWRQSSAQTRVLSITFLIVCKYICLTRWFESFA
jgi:hypothetical protein